MDKTEKKVIKKFKETSEDNSRIFTYTIGLTIAIFSLSFIFSYALVNINEVFLSRIKLILLIGLFLMIQAFFPKKFTIAFLICMAVIVSFFFPNEVINTNQIIIGIEKDISELKGNISNIENQLTEYENTTKLCLVYPNERSGSFYVNESGCTVICPAE